MKKKWNQLRENNDGKTYSYSIIIHVYVCLVVVQRKQEDALFAPSLRKKKRDAMMLYLASHPIPSHVMATYVIKQVCPQE